MDLFEYARELNKDKESPLAGRMRPATLDEVVGQEHIIGKDKLLYRAIKADKISSIIFYGPPGTGKTTLAKVIANTTKANFVQMNATTSGKKDMQEAVADAKESLGMYQKKTILFIDEIHRFNKAQQDYLLPFVEDGTIILIGATTENPYFEVNQALISRSNVFELHSLDKEDIKKLIVRAITDDEKGMGIYGATITDDALDFLSDMAEGDARSALNAIELGILTTEPAEDGKIHIDIDVAQECIQRRVTKYDKDGDNHYDVISAFIKSMRYIIPMEWVSSSRDSYPSLTKCFEKNTSLSVPTEAGSRSTYLFYENTCITLIFCKKEKSVIFEKVSGNFFLKIFPAPIRSALNRFPSLF